MVGLSISTMSLLQNYRLYLADIRYVWCVYLASGELALFISVPSEAPS